MSRTGPRRAHEDTPLMRFPSAVLPGSAARTMSPASPTRRTIGFAPTAVVSYPAVVVNRFYSCAPPTETRSVVRMGSPEGRAQMQPVVRVRPPVPRPAQSLLTPAEPALAAGWFQAATPPMPMLGGSPPGRVAGWRSPPMQRPGARAEGPRSARESLRKIHGTHESSPALSQRDLSQGPPPLGDGETSPRVLGTLDEPRPVRSSESTETSPRLAVPSKLPRAAPRSVLAARN